MGNALKNFKFEFLIKIIAYKNTGCVIKNTHLKTIIFCNMFFNLFLKLLYTLILRKRHSFENGL